MKPIHLVTLSASIALSISACDPQRAAGHRVGQGGEGAGAGGSVTTSGPGASTGPSATTGPDASSSSGSSGGGAGSSASSASSSSGGPACVFPMDDAGTVAGKTVPSNLLWQSYPEGGGPLAPLSIQSLYDCDGQKGITALLFLESATWCATCKAEALEIDDQAAAWAPSGIRVITLMAQDQVGDPATPATALAWRDFYDLTSVAVAADPNFAFEHAGPIGWPMAIVVDPRTMKIVSVSEGYPVDHAALEALAQQNAN